MTSELTFHYGAIEPVEGYETEEEAIKLTFHYGAIEPFSKWYVYRPIIY
mgnify:CR=1 FL=1